MTKFRIIKQTLGEGYSLFYVLQKRVWGVFWKTVMISEGSDYDCRQKLEKLIK